MRKKYKIFTVLSFAFSFIPQIIPNLKPINFFIQNDPDVISIKYQDSETHYRLNPRNNVFKIVKEGKRIDEEGVDTKEKVHLYVSKSEENINKQAAMVRRDEQKDIETSDDLFIAIFKNELSLITKHSSFKEVSNILNALDKAYEIRTKSLHILSNQRERELLRLLNDYKKNTRPNVFQLKTILTQQ